MGVGGFYLLPVDGLELPYGPKELKVLILST